MSCGNPHDTDCAEVIEAVYLYLDGECDETAHRKIRLHLDECAPCLRKYGVEQDVKALVARCCADDVPPDGLRDRVLAKLAKVRTEISHLEYRAE
ncbi:MAG: mycothiol system anti-sigma-R factor [Mycobacteriales bacterium]